MNKKIIALLSLVGIAGTLAGCNMNVNSENFKENIDEFKQHMAEYSKLSSEKANKTIFNKYKLSIFSPNDATLVNGEELNVEETNNAPNQDKNIEKDANEMPKSDTINKIAPETIENSAPKTIETENDYKTKTLENNLENAPKVVDEINPNSNKDEKISTLYSLSDDINSECEDFSTLKNNLTSAIIETQNLIDKINKKEINLTAEQRMLITEQSKQLKNLGRQLSHITTELSLNLSDLASLMRENGDLDNISLKYLVVLDNLINGNEMLENGLNSLNLINSMFNMSNRIPPNNGRILYGFRRNNEPPVIKDYVIDENGKLVENKTPDNEQNEATNTENNTQNAKQDTKLKTNIDTYRGNRSNIDSFFNTALLDNEFMYGNNRFGGAYGPGMMGYGGGFNPYYENQYVNQNEQEATKYRVINEDNTQNNERDTADDNKENTVKESKKRGLKKNVDTYKTADTPSLSTRIKNIKSSFSNFFSKFSKPKSKIENPVYKYEQEIDNN